MRKVLFFAFLLLGSHIAKGQQDPMYTQYMFNMLTVNPAYAGSRGMLSAVALVREQWVGINGRPRTQTLSIHSPLPRRGLAAGLTVVNDIAGPVRNTAINLDGVYRLRLTGLNQFLSFGLKAGINMFQANINQLAIDDVNDVAFASNIENVVLPNFGFGVYYYSPVFYAGISAPRLFQNKLENRGAVFTTQKRHFFATAGIVVDIGNGVLKFKPSTLVKAVEGAPVELDLSAAFIYRNKLTVGLMYRIEDAVGAFVQYQITDQFRAGYAYDYTLTDLTQYTTGSHEIMIGYDLYYHVNKMKSPRFF